MAAANLSQSQSDYYYFVHGSNQSRAEKNNRPLFREQWVLLFSKNKMAVTNFSQSGAQLSTKNYAQKHKVPTLPYRTLSR